MEAITVEEQSGALESRESELYLVLREQPQSALVSRYKLAYDAVAKLAREAAAYQTMLATIERVWREQLAQTGGTQLITGDDNIVVQLVPGKTTPIKNDPLFLELLVRFCNDNALSLDELKDCAWLIRPEPEVHTDLTAIKQLAKKYGKPVQDIIDRCVERRTAPSTLHVQIKDGGK